MSEATGKNEDDLRRQYEKARREVEDVKTRFEVMGYDEDLVLDKIVYSLVLYWDDKLKQGPENLHYLTECVEESEELDEVTRIILKTYFRKDLGECEDFDRVYKGMISSFAEDILVAAEGYDVD